MPKGVYPRSSHCCTKCGETDPKQFYGTRRTECKIHASERTRANYKKDSKAVNRRRHLKRTYGITPEQYDTKLADQHGLCALCGKPPDETDLQKILVVDHDHETDEMRGLIHGRCNAVLGYAKDDTSLLLNAIHYVNRYRKS